MTRIVRREHHRRGVFGWIVKLAFVGYNLLMAVWLWMSWRAMGEGYAELSEEGKAGAAIGGMMGTGVILFFWASGAVILGLAVLLTRGKKVIIEESEDRREPRGW